MSRDLRHRLLQEVDRLRRYAYALVRNPVDADDLVQ
jgi:DNA-directed RNA polymerase specialized sigma24 family protein